LATGSVNRIYRSVKPQPFHIGSSASSHMTRNLLRTNSHGLVPESIRNQPVTATRRVISCKCCRWRQKHQCLRRTSRRQGHLADIRLKASSPCDLNQLPTSQAVVVPLILYLFHRPTVCPPSRLGEMGSCCGGSPVLDNYAIHAKVVPPHL